jgi:ribonuclease HII
VSAAPRIAGVDEAGRGCLAGPVYAAAVILNPARPIVGLADSKQLSEKKRDALAIEIKAHALAYAVASASVEEIDTINILQASLLAMQRAVAALSIVASEAWIDGNIAPKLNANVRCKTFVGGDALHDCISAASILAKTERDAALVALSAAHPQYGFAQHKGYGTAAHLRALRSHGVIEGVHRKSFAPVRAQLALPFA